MGRRKGKHAESTFFSGAANVELARGILWSANVEFLWLRGIGPWNWFVEFFGVANVEFSCRALAGILGFATGFSRW